MIRVSLLALPILAALVVPSQAKTYKISIENQNNDAITRIVVRDGTIKDFVPVPAFGTKEFIVTIPDGKCRTDVRAEWQSGRIYSDAKLDFCKYGGIVFYPPKP